MSKATVTGGVVAPAGSEAARVQEMSRPVTVQAQPEPDAVRPVDEKAPLSWSSIRIVPEEGALPSFSIVIWKLLLLPAFTLAGLWLFVIARSTTSRVWSIESVLFSSRSSGSPTVVTEASVVHSSAACDLTLVRSFRRGAWPPAAIDDVRVQVIWVPRPGELQSHPATVEPETR